MPRKYHAEKLPCGMKWCPAALRMLWPERAIKHRDIALIYGVNYTLVPRRAEAIA